MISINILSGDPVQDERPSISLGASAEWKSPDQFGSNLILEGSYHVNESILLQCGLNTDVMMQNATVYLLIGLEELFDFISLRLDCSYNSFHSDHLAEFTALGSGILYNDFIELELGAGWKSLFSYLDIQQNIDYFQLAYRLEFIYLDIDNLRMSAQIGNFNNFSLGNISAFAYTMKNIVSLSESLKLKLLLAVHNPGAWAFSSYYSGIDLTVSGVCYPGN